MDPKSLEALRKRFDQDAWRGTTTLDREVVRRGVSLPGDLLGELSRVREIDPGDGSRLLRSTWSTPGDASVMICMDLWECESREMAHDRVLEMLGNVEAPDVARMETPIGDVSFGRGEPTALILARGNLAIWIGNGGETVVPVDALARKLDDWIVQGEG